MRSALAALALAATSTAWAQAARTWVSGVGDDANPCSRTAPCKTFAGAISKTTAGGEIDVLDPGGFGTVTITKAITIDGRAAHAGTLSSGVNGIVVNAGAGDVVVLRGLSIVGGGTGLNGIRFLAGRALHVEDCEIRGFLANSGISGYGIDFSPSAAAQLFVRNTTLHENRVADIHVSGARALIEKSSLANASIGLSVAGGAEVTLHDSLVAGNSASGIQVEATSQVTVDGGIVAQNGVGIQADATSTVRISEVMVSQNTTGLSGPITAIGTNRLAAGNGTNGAPVSTLPER